MRSRVLLGAPSAIGIRPYDEGGVRRLDLAPGALRSQGLARRLQARDLGDVMPPPGYCDLDRPEERCRNEDDVAAYSRKLAEPIVTTFRHGEFLVLLGGDCSILLGALLGLRNAGAVPVGLVYIDAHADFATLAESPSHSACSMNLALATGRADRPLAHLTGDGPLVHGDHVVHIGRRDDAQPAYGHPALAPSGVLDLPHAAIHSRGIVTIARQALERVAPIDAGFWIHFDVDVLDPDLMPAVDSPLPGGLSFAQAAQLLGALVQHPAALGLQITIYDPTLDPDGSCASQLADMLEQACIPADR
jgi:arginase